MIDDFERHDLDGKHAFYTGRLPQEFAVDPTRFDQLWAIHPVEYHEIQMGVTRRPLCRISVV